MTYAMLLELETNENLLSDVGIANINLTELPNLN